MSSHPFPSDQAASEAGYPFHCSCGLYHSSDIGAAYCPECKESSDHAYRSVTHAATGKVVFLRAAHAEEAARDAAEEATLAEETALAAKPLTHNPFAVLDKENAR